MGAQKGEHARGHRVDAVDVMEPDGCQNVKKGPALAYRTLRARPCGRRAASIWRSWSGLLPLEKLEDGLRGLVRLGEDGDARLLQNLVADHLAGEGGDVGVADTAFAAAEVLDGDADVATLS